MLSSLAVGTRFTVERKHEGSRPRNWWAGRFPYPTWFKTLCVTQRILANLELIGESVSAD